MKQAVMTAPGVIVFRDVDIPKIGPGEVLVKIKRIGVCGSDVHVYHGKHPFTGYPVVQGHEVAGEIAEVAPDVSSFKKGDRVTIQPQVVCGICYPCRHGDYHICDNLKVMGFQTTGMASEYFAVDGAKVLKLPDSADFDEIAVIEPIAVACHCLKQSDTDLRGASIVIFGAGPIGNLVGQTAKAKGARVLITDISDFRLELAKQCGIDYTVNTRHTDVLEAIIQAFGQDKADMILDCAGNQTTVTDAVRCARKGTDTKILHGSFKNIDPAEYPCLLGHEGVGEVVEVGKNVTGSEVGDKILLPFIENPPEGYSSYWGAFSEYAVCGDWKAMANNGQGPGSDAFGEFYYTQSKLPRDIDPIDATMIITFREVLSAAKKFGFGPGKSVAIFGAGPVGLSFVKFAKILGMAPIILFDIESLCFCSPSFLSS